MSEEKIVVTSLEEEGDIAADYLEGLLDIADLDGDIEISVENERAALVIEGGDLAHLVGGEGEVLDALQELTRLAVQTVICKFQNRAHDLISDVQNKFRK